MAHITRRKAIRLKCLDCCCGNRAEVYGINDGKFSRKLRHELPPQEREKILAIIEELAKEGC